MGSDIMEVVPVPQKSSGTKAHSSMCRELTEVLDKINCILPAIESARPGCMSGIKELCSLNNTIEKANLLLKHCSESSKFYLALTGEATLSRCDRIKTALDQSLRHIQNMVPQLLATQISEAVDYLRDAKFVIDSTEEEAGKAMLELLRQSDSNEELEFETFRIVALRLNITAPRSLLIEKRSIKKLLDKVRGNDPKKERVLTYFLYLINTYGKKLRSDGNAYKENTSTCSIPASTMSKCSINSSEENDEPTDHQDVQIENSCANTAPEEFCCPISSRLMYDPVVIASGQTYERICIEKWFSEGHDTCPKTQKKLENLSMIPNTCMRDLISNWCKKNGIKIQDICLRPNLMTYHSWEPSHSYSMSSLKNVSTTLLNRNSGSYILQNDHSNISYFSSDASCCSDSSPVKGIDSLDGSFACKFSWSNDYQRCQSFSYFNQDMFLKFFYTLSELPLEIHGKAVEDMKNLMEDDEEACYSMLSTGFCEALMKFLKNAKDISDVQAQKVGAQILHSFLSNCRVEIPSLSEYAFWSLTSCLDYEITTESLMIMQKLVHHPNCKSYIQASGVPSLITKVLDIEDSEHMELALRILYDLSCHKEIRSHILSSGCISSLVSLLSNGSEAGICLKILRNLSDSKEALQMIAETNGCLASIAELLDSSSCEEQENAVVILHALCSHSTEYCQLVLTEGVIPALVHISINGNHRGKESSKKLLNLLRDLRVSGSFESLKPQSGSTSGSTEDFIDRSVTLQPTSKSSNFFRRKMKFFSKSLIPF